MLDEMRARDEILNALALRIPVDTGALAAHFFDGGLTSGSNFSEADMLKNPLIYYGFILNNSPTIRYALKKNGHIYTYLVRKNKHFRFMDNFFEGEAIRIFEREMGVKLI